MLQPMTLNLHGTADQSEHARIGHVAGEPVEGLAVAAAAAAAAAVAGYYYFVEA